MSIIKVPVVLAGRDMGDGSQVTKLFGTKKDALEWLGRTEEEFSGSFYDEGGFIEEELHLEQQEDGGFKLVNSPRFDTDDVR